jgi:predicted phage-related endonuclease
LSLLAGTPEWHAARRNGIGASEVGVLFGCDPYRTQAELYAMKVGELVDEETEEMRMGRLLEPFLLTLCRTCENCGQRRKLQAWQEMVIDGEAPHLFSTPDAYYEDCSTGANDGVLETKATSEAESPAGPPLRWQLQVASQQSCTGARHAKIAALYQSTRFRIHDVPRNDAVITAIRERVEWWWWTYVRRGVVPRDPARPLPEHILDALYPKEVAGKTVVLPPEAVEWNDRAVELQKEIAKSTRHLEEYKCWLKEAMGDAERGVVPGRDRVWQWKTKKLAAQSREAGTTREFRRVKR